ncbi:hypothetical protein Tco_1327342 [Tanacetum coccineum]
MSNHEQLSPCHPGLCAEYDRKEKANHPGLRENSSAVDLEKFCEKHFVETIPIMADKFWVEKRMKEKDVES